MESFLNRYRNLTVLLLVLCAQLVLLAVQVKNEQDVRIIRVWTVTAVTPAARIIEGLRGGSIGFVRNYILLRDTNEENKRLQSELDRLKIENRFLKAELNTSERAKALSIFQSRTSSRTVAATIIGTGAGSGSKVVFVDRGTVAGVQRGMAVVTPDGIVGKVISAYPTASEVLLITDPDFAAGVISQKTQVRGTLKGQGSPLCKVDYVPIEEKVEVGEWLYTSGDDRIFPKGFPVGIVKVVRNAQPFKEILVEPAGTQHGLEDVLILLEGVHQSIPDTPPVATPIYMTPPSAPEPASASAAPPPAGNTEADKIRQRYKSIGETQNHVYGENPPGARAVDFNAKPPATPAAGAAGTTGQPSGALHPTPPGAAATPAPPAANPTATPGQAPATNRVAVPQAGPPVNPKPATAKPATPGTGVPGTAPPRSAPPGRVPVAPEAAAPKPSGAQKKSNPSPPPVDPL